jgi:hypothetical protein
VFSGLPSLLSTVLIVEENPSAATQFCGGARVHARGKRKNFGVSVKLNIVNKTDKRKREKKYRDFLSLMIKRTM